MLWLISSPLGRWISSGAVIALSFVTWLVVHDAKVVNKERARVETKGSEIDAKAQARRRAAESNPAGVLSKYYRD